MLRLDLVSTSVSMIVLIVLVGISTDNKVIHATWIKISYIERNLRNEKKEKKKKKK